MPQSPASLAAQVASAAAALARARIEAEGPDAAHPGGHLRVAVDGPVAADAAQLADAIAGWLTERAVPVARVRADDFLRARSLRLEFGDDPQAFLEGWYDLAALRREVLDPLGPGGSRHWLPRLRDPVTDRPYRQARQLAPAGLIAVLDGRFFARWEIADAIDLRVHLDVSPAARARRLPAADRDRVLGAWDSYLRWFDPAGTAQVVVRHDRPAHPAVLTPAPGA